MRLIFAEFATSLKSPKIDTAKNKPYNMSSLRVVEIAKIRLSQNLTHLSSVIFAKISRREKFPIYCTCITTNLDVGRNVVVYKSSYTREVWHHTEWAGTWFHFRSDRSTRQILQDVKHWTLMFTYKAIVPNNSNHLHVHINLYQCTTFDVYKIKGFPVIH